MSKVVVNPDVGRLAPRSIVEETSRMPQFIHGFEREAYP